MNLVWVRCSQKVALRFWKTVLDWFFSFLPLRHEYRGSDTEGRTSSHADWIRPGVDQVSTRDQNLELQLDALNKAECQRIFTDKLSGVQVERPGLKEALSHLREADTLVVWKLDRLGRSVKRLVDLVNELETQKVHFQSMTDGVDNQDAGRALLLPRNGKSSPDGARADIGAHPCRTGGRPVPGTGRGPKAPDDRQQGSGGEKAIGKRDAATGGGAQLRRVGPYVISMGAGLFTDVRTPGRI
jgi:hypothetical protein